MVKTIAQIFAMAPQIIQKSKYFWKYSHVRFNWLIAPKWKISQTYCWEHSCFWKILNAISIPDTGDFTICIIIQKIQKIVAVKPSQKKQHVIFTNPLKYIPRNAVICQDRTLHLQEHSKQIIFLSPCLMFDNSNVISKSGFVKSDTKIPNQY